MQKDELIVTTYEAKALALRLSGKTALGFIPGDPDEPEAEPGQPDLYLCAASYLENGGKISVKARVKTPVVAKEPPVDTADNPPKTREPQAGNPTEPERRKVLEGDDPPAKTRLQDTRPVAPTIRRAR